MTKECECAAHSAAECVCGAWDEPSRRPWVGLTDEEKQACIRHVNELGKYAPQSVADDERLLIETVEAKLKEKNA